MTPTKLLLIRTAFVLVACGGSSYMAQDIFLVNQGFEKLSNSDDLEAEAYLGAALAETNRSYQKEIFPFPVACEEPCGELSENDLAIKTLSESFLNPHIFWT